LEARAEERERLGEDKHVEPWGRDQKHIPSVDLNDAIFPRVRAESILDIALADNAKVTDGLESRATEHVVLIIGQSLRRCDDDGITGVRS
jgi:hypothetical protein